MSSLLVSLGVTMDHGKKKGHDMKRAMMAMAAVVVLAAGTARAQDKAHEPELNDPGSWAYEGCKQALLEKVKKDRPLVQTIEINGRVGKERQSDRKSLLTGEARFEREGEMKHITFSCTVNRDDKKIEKVTYEKK